GIRVDLVTGVQTCALPIFDENGRIYVAEMADYPLGPPGGRIKLLESTKGDGHYDKCTLFASNLPYPNGVMPWKGGVLVTASPDKIGRASCRERVQRREEGE